MAYHASRKKSLFSRRRFWLISACIIAVIAVGGVWAIRSWYSDNLSPVSSDVQIQYFTVEPGMGLPQIAKSLQQQKLIRSSQAFVTYVRSNEYQDKLQAGTYELSPSMSVQQIVQKLAKGQVAKNLLTILPGKRLDQIQAAFQKAGYTPDQMAAAFRPAVYAGHPALASLPAGASLEGYLYPDSFQKEVNTPAEVIIKGSLDEMQQHLTPDLINNFAAQGLNTYQGITLASIVLQESDSPADMPTIAQVFLLRLKKNMPLGSDVTAFYASALAAQPPNVTIESPYNTRLHPGLPPGPISNVTGDALSAVAHPSTTDYLFFVAGDDGKVHFTRTQAEHEAAIKQYCQKGCGQ
jgi:UPF0755 protein